MIQLNTNPSCPKLYRDPSPGLAIALWATKRRPEAIGSEKLHPLLPWVTVGAPVAAAPGADKRNKSKGRSTTAAAAAGGGSDLERGKGAPGKAEEALSSDCPLTLGDEDAIGWSVPPSLLEVAFQSGGRLDAVRIWTTCLSVCSLMDMNETLLLDDDFTLADRGFQWLEEQGMLFPPFGLILGATLAQAREMVSAWERYHVRPSHFRALVEIFC